MSRLEVRDEKSNVLRFRTAPAAVAIGVAEEQVSVLSELREVSHHAEEDAETNPPRWWSRRA